GKESIFGAVGGREFPLRFRGQSAAVPNAERQRLVPTHAVEGQGVGHRVVVHAFGIGPELAAPPQVVLHEARFLEKLIVPFLAPSAARYARDGAVARVRERKKLFREKLPEPTDG